MNETMTDRELDAWLAEHLFGVTDSVVMFNGEVVQVGMPGDTARAFGYYSAYSSTGEGMLMVLARMFEGGWNYELINSDYGGHRASFEASHGTQRITARAGSLPRAVAEAARAAIEAEA